MAGIAPTRVAQVAVIVTDLERAKSFYRDVLGLAHLFDAPPGLAFFQCGETRLMLTPPEGLENPGSAILYYGVDDVEAAHRAMAGEGVAFAQTPKIIAQVDGRDVWLALAHDSEGNMFGLISG